MNKETHDKISAAIMDNQMMRDYLLSKKDLSRSNVATLIETLDRQKSELNLAIISITNNISKE